MHCGVAPPAVGVAELRADMVTAGQGNAQIGDCLV